MRNKIVDIISTKKNTLKYPLKKVGMNNISIPIKKDGMHYVANVDILVSLDNTNSRGIHMSRLYHILQEQLSQQEINQDLIKNILITSIESQAGLSKNSFLKISFDYIRQKKALLSENYGWLKYPLEIRASLQNGTFDIEYAVKVFYSSTCPCSAALSRELIRDNFTKQHPEENSFTKDYITQWLNKSSSIIGTPHSQKSHAYIRFVPSKEFELKKFLILIEDTIKTSVQTAVKREDEQQFALLNGTNLMFCEDSCRILKKQISQNKLIKDFYIKISHLESLHYHDAIAEDWRDDESRYCYN